MHTGSFTLVKWYMDCVSDAGDAAILYCADLRWRSLHATMGGLLYSGAGEGTQSRTVLGRHRVVASGDEILAEHPRLNVTGCWRRACPPFQRTVYEKPEGSIEWNCVQPAARVQMRIGARELTGLGYAECLTLTLPSWRLPIRSLRWGRFVSPDHALTWIDWQGEHSTRLGVFDGRECALGAVSQSEVTVEGADLRIDAGDSLRAGRLNSTIVAGAPGLKRLFPASLFNIREQKWKSRGTLTCSGQVSEGWVIHEVVDWEA